MSRRTLSLLLLGARAAPLLTARSRHRPLIVATDAVTPQQELSDDPCGRATTGLADEPEPAQLGLEVALAFGV